MRAGMVALAVGLACAAGTSGPSRPSMAPPVAVAHRLSTTLHQQTGRGFVHLAGGPDAVTVLASGRNLEPG
jgi:hypothetical protein